MLARFKRRSGNRYTFISIIMIIAMLYFFRFAFGGTKGEYPKTVYFTGHNYTYSQMVKSSPVKFVRNYGESYNGYVILTMRGDKETPEKVYIYEGWKNYREYVLQE